MKLLHMIDQQSRSAILRAYPIVWQKQYIESIEHTLNRFILCLIRIAERGGSACVISNEEASFFEAAYEFRENVIFLLAKQETTVEQELLALSYNLLDGVLLRKNKTASPQAKFDIIKLFKSSPHWQTYIRDVTAALKK